MSSAKVIEFIFGSPSEFGQATSHARSAMTSDREGRWIPMTTGTCCTYDGAFCGRGAIVTNLEIKGSVPI